MEARAGHDRVPAGSRRHRSPLPHIIEDESGLLLMPAYTWSKRGNKVVLLQSEDGGRVWKVRSVITTAVAMIQAGARVVHSLVGSDRLANQRW